MKRLKGLSPLVSSILLVALVVGIAAILINWATSYSREQIQMVKENTKTNCAYVSANFDGDPTVYAHNTSGTYYAAINISIYNTGQSSFSSSKQIAVWSDDTVTTFNKTISLGIDDYQFVSLVADGTYGTSKQCTGANSCPSLKRLTISVDNCEGNPIVWKAS